jgi:hypothetical protein
VKNNYGIPQGPTVQLSQKKKNNGTQLDLMRVKVLRQRECWREKING